MSDRQRGEERDEGGVTAAFQGLDPVKQSAIFNAALKEFSSKGFANASTNEIVRDAGISKGLLFHYFQTKKDLFLFLVDYGVNLVQSEYLSLLKTTEPDLFERYRQASLLKLDIIRKHPHMFDFLSIALATEAEDVRNEITAQGRAIQAELLEGIDLSRFRRGIDVQRALQLIGWAIEGYATKLQRELAGLPLSQVDYSAFLAEFDAYLDVLRTCFYE